jgi:phage terminase small subunit
MSTKRRSKAPEHFSEPTRSWWDSVVESYQLEPHHLRLLQLAGETWDRVQQAREALSEGGLTYANRFGNPVLRPEVAVERDGRLAFARLVRELDLDVDGPAEPRSRPPGLRSNGRV